MSATFAVLTKELQRLGLPLPDGTGRNGKLLRADIEDSIAEFYFRSCERSFNERVRLNLHSVQLAYRYDILSSDAQDRLFDSDDWIVEEKFDGARVVLIYNDSDGFSVFGRNRQRKTCLPMDYTEKLLLPAGNDGLQPGKFFAGKLKNLAQELKHGFVLDCELIALNNLQISNANTTLQSTVTSLLALNTLESHTYQRSAATLMPVMFDLLPVDAAGNVVTSMLFVQRRALLDAVYKDNLIMQRFKLAQQFTQNKQHVYDKLISAGKEGVVFKNLYSAYVPGRCDYRSQSACVKLKRRLTGVADIDAFIIGYTLGDAYTALNLIAGLKLGVYVRDDKGALRLEHIASVSGIPMPLRVQMTRLNKDTQLPELNPDFMYRVVEVDGQDFSSLNKRITHAVINWQRGFRQDKTHDMCVLDETFIDSQIF